MKKTITVLILLSFCSCKFEQEKKEYALLNQASWFLGEWHCKSSYGDFTEKWEKLSDSTMIGESHIVQGKDTVFKENIVLEQRNDSLYYNVLMKDSNLEKNTTFYLTQSGKNHLVFENPKNDFPTKIVYKLIKPDSIFAIIQGKEKGVMKTESFPLSKKK